MMKHSISLELLNAAKPDIFVEMLEGIFEHSAWIPEQVYRFRPFESVFDLHSRMVQAVENASLADQLSLLRAHPELAGREAQKGTLTELSASEQSSVGMSSLSPHEMQEVKRLNEQYSQKFGFPFIIAVLDNTREDIFKKWHERLDNNPELERRACLQQVYLIAQLRLNTLIKG